MTREDKILKELKSGTSDGLEELIEGYYPEILRYCIWHTPDRAAAEDAVQETFLKVIRYMDEYTHRGKFRAFLYKVASNTCKDIWRARKHAEPLSEDAAYTEAAFETVESDVDLRLLTARLPDSQREVLLLRFAQELTLREIAKVLDLPLRTVQSRLRAALKALEKQIEKGDCYP